MRTLLALAAVLFLGAVAMACAFWAGYSQGAPLAFALVGAALVIIVPLWMDGLGNWGAPGDGKSIRSSLRR
mgnify:CR=1 FL=1|jgi:hypothetical protein